MENFKLASQQRLRFQTTKGILSTEQLWDLSLEDLDNLAASLEAEYKESGKKSFLSKVSAKDKTIRLKFDIVIDILQTKVEEKELAIEARETKEHNKKIIALIVEKKDEALKGKSIRELEAMMK